MKLASPALLRGLMEKHKLSHRKLAKACGLQSHTMIGQLLDGTKTSCSADLAERISAALGVETDFLFMLPSSS
jgi:plasmid maintenance system antidote protein VapI